MTMSAAHQRLKQALSTGQLAEARQHVHTSPTEAQQRAGNYAKGHVHWKGLRVSIENPRGSTRSGTDADGATWSIKMKHDYGYFRGIIGKDLSEIELRDVRNVLVKYGILDRLLGIGDVGLATAGHAGVEIKLTGCRDPERIRKIIVDAKDRLGASSYRAE